MSSARELAEDYAKSVAEGIREQVEAGAMFGYQDGWGTRVDSLADIDGYSVDEHDADNLPDGWDTASAGDYVSDALDTHYIVNADKTYRHARVFVTLGGPNVYVDTEERALFVTWGSGSARENLPETFCEAIDEYLSEYWDA
ncbi:MAG: hypothetical protein IJO71_09265 [Microbacterium sp.]|uniref:hypothetical protein n=1 Tax=Microbacterium sp. TaxID=51671 RepID=UPI002600ADD0|nr:hypothetical protein [Microbacterium sp.]MBQ9917370.1 hypothetical protein [Microbacterium sp.]